MTRKKSETIVVAGMAVVRCDQYLIEWHRYIYDFVGEGRLLGKTGFDLVPTMEDIDRVLGDIDRRRDLLHAPRMLPCLACGKDGQTGQIAEWIADWYSASAFLEFLHDTERERAHFKVFQQSVEKVCVRVSELGKIINGLV